MSNEKSTKALCRDLASKLGNGYQIEDEGREMRLYHRSGKRRGMCCATYLSEPAEMAHAIAAVLAAHKAARKPLTKETISASFDCFSMAMSHYAYGDPSRPAEYVLKRDAESKLAMGGRGYFEGYNITHKMKVVLLDRCRHSIAEVRWGVSTDGEGCSYNSVTIKDPAAVA